MNLLFTYVADFSPIFIGILTFYMIRSVHLSRHRVKIYYSPRKRRDVFETHAREDSERLIFRTFKEYVKDELIISGILSRRKINYGKVAFSKFGIIADENLHLLSKYLKVYKKNQIILFLSDQDIFINQILRFGVISGLLLAYAIDYKLYAVSGLNGKS